tara:strand:+ start:2300 stop:2908 length:609 start_codon:yes stop_codon:yes gene_type:complete
MSEKPWDKNPDLKEDRIVEIANLICEVRGDVIDLHDVVLGDTRLSLGMRAYECCRSRLISEDSQGTWPWFSILTAVGRFTFLFGKTPVRFVRNDPENLPSEKLIPSPEASIQMGFFDEDYDHANTRWFFVIDTFYKNVADNMYFVGYNEQGDIVCQWDIPLEAKAVLLSSLEEEVVKPNEISKATVKVKSAPEKVNESKNGE